MNSKSTKFQEISRLNQSAFAFSPRTSHNVSLTDFVGATSTPLCNENYPRDSVPPPSLPKLPHFNSRRYSLSDISANFYSQQPTKSLRNGGHSNFGINLRTYTDSKSPGLSERIVQYNNQTHENRSTHQPKYGSPGLFPIVHLFKKEIPVINPSPRKVTVRVASPDSPGYSSPDQNRIILESAICRPGDNHDTSTQSVLDALREISRKRMHSNDDSELSGEVLKRQRTEQKDTPDGPMKRGSFFVDPFTASYTSSRFHLERSIRKKRKANDAPKTVEPKQIKITDAETQTVPEVVQNRESPKVPDDSLRGFSAPKPMEVISSELTADTKTELASASSVKPFSEGYMKLNKTKKLSAVFEIATGKESGVMDKSTPEAEEVPVSILSPPNKEKHNKHVTFQISENEEAKSAESKEITEPQSKNEVPVTSAPSFGILPTSTISNASLKTTSAFSSSTMPTVTSTVVTSSPLSLITFGQTSKTPPSSKNSPQKLGGFKFDFGPPKSKPDSKISTPPAVSTGFPLVPPVSESSTPSRPSPSFSKKLSNTSIKPKQLDLTSFSKPSHSLRDLPVPPNSPEPDSSANTAFVFGPIPSSSNPILPNSSHTATVCKESLSNSSNFGGNIFGSISSAVSGESKLGLATSASSIFGTSTTSTTFGSNMSTGFSLPVVPAQDLPSAALQSNIDMKTSSLTPPSNPFGTLSTSASVPSIFGSSKMTSSTGFGAQTTSTTPLFNPTSKPMFTTTFGASSLSKTTPSSVTVAPITTSSVFGLPAASASSSTMPVSGFATSASTFGTASAAPLFGVPSTSAPTFGASSTSSSVFGISSTPTAAFGAPSTSSSVFGVSSTPTAAFGISSSSVPTFGTSTSVPTFGTSTSVSTFGTSTAVPTFGTSSTPAPAFGASSTPALAFGAPTPASAFGSSSTHAPAFGTPVSSALFSGLAQSPVTTTASINFGAGFGTLQPSFGVASTPPVPFGTPVTSSSVFGSPTPLSIFDSPATSTPAFGAALSGSVPRFGATELPKFEPIPSSATSTAQFGFGSSGTPAFGSVALPAASSAFGSGNQNTVFGGSVPATTAPATFGASTFAKAFGQESAFGNNFGSFGVPVSSTSQPPAFFGSPAVTVAQPASGAFQFGSANAAPAGTSSLFSFGSSEPPKSGGFNFVAGGNNPTGFGGAAVPTFATPFNPPTAGVFSIGTGSSTPKSRSQLRGKRRN